MSTRSDGFPYASPATPGNFAHKSATAGPEFDLDWHCSGCGRISPGQRRICTCATDCLHKLTPGGILHATKHDPASEERSSDWRAGYAQCATDLAVIELDPAKTTVLRLYTMSGSWGDPAHIVHQPDDSLIVKRVRELLAALAKAETDLAEARAMLARLEAVIAAAIEEGR